MTKNTGAETRAVMLFLNNREILEALDDADRGRLTLALFDYLEFGTAPDFTGALAMAFLVLRRDIDLSVLRWQSVCASRSAAGRKGAAARSTKKFADNVSCNDDLMEQDEASRSTVEQDEVTPDAVEQNEATVHAVQQTQATLNTGKQTQATLVTVQQTQANEAYTYSNSNTNTNTNPYTNTNSYSNTSSVENPASAGRGGAGHVRKDREQAFGRFWQAYPRKVGKQAARRVFDRISVPTDQLLRALERQCGEDQWKRENGRYIPYPATWLSQARWEDEPPAPQPDCRTYGVLSL